MKSSTLRLILFLIAAPSWFFVMSGGLSSDQLVNRPASLGWMVQNADRIFVGKVVSIRYVGVSNGLFLGERLRVVVSVGTGQFLTDRSSSLHRLLVMDFDEISMPRSTTVLDPGAEFLWFVADREYNTVIMVGAHSGLFEINLEDRTVRNGSSNAGLWVGPGDLWNVVPRDLVRNELLKTVSPEETIRLLDFGDQTADPRRPIPLDLLIAVVKAAKGPA